MIEKRIMELYEGKHSPELPGLFVYLNPYYDNIVPLPLIDWFYFFCPDWHFLYFTGVAENLQQSLRTLSLLKILLIGVWIQITI